jgi:hypothetical protein
MNVFDEMGVYWAEIADQSHTEKQIQFIKNTLKGNELFLDPACETGEASLADFLKTVPKEEFKKVSAKTKEGERVFWT